VVKFNDAVARTLELPEVRKKFERDALEAKAMTPEEITRYMVSETDKWAPIAKRVVQPQ
jgi:tripartite-type tricarboxylate transporter receptor subunit TctC